MWATHRGLSKPCANRASCPSPSGTGSSRWCQVFLSGLHLQIQEIAEEDWLLAILARTAETYNLTKMIALGTALLAEVADVAGCAFVDGVCDERGSLAERLAQECFLQIWQGGVAQTEGTLAAGIGAKATAAAAAWFGAQQTMLWRERRRSGIVMSIVTDGVCGD